MTYLTPNILIVILNVNSLTAPIKRKKLSGWTKKKQNPVLSSLLKNRGKNRLQGEKKYIMLILIKSKLY